MYFPAILSNPNLIHLTLLLFAFGLSLLKARRGKFVYVTFGQPHFRKHLLEREEWEVESRELGDTWHYYLYVARFK